MTDKQNKIFVDLMSIGYSMGCYHVFECYANWELHFIGMLSGSDPIEYQNKILDTIIEFWKLTAGSPEEEEKYKNLDRCGMMVIINDWYRDQRNKRYSGGVAVL